MKMTVQKQLLLLVLLYSLCQLGVPEREDQCHMYVVGQDGEPCPENSTCYNLSHYLDHQQLFTDNTTLCFLKGHHYLDGENSTILNITQVKNVTLLGLAQMEQGFHETVMQSPAIIKCREHENGGIIFSNSQNVLVSNLTITGCRSRHHNCSQYLLSNSLSPFLVQNSSHVTIVFFSIQNGTTGLEATKVDYLLVRSSSFTNLIQYFKDSGTVMGTGLNISKSMHLNISHSIFSFNYQGICLSDNTAPPGGANILITKVTITSNLGTGIYISGKNRNISIEYANINNGGRVTEEFCTLNNCTHFLDSKIQNEVSGLYTKMKDSVLIIKHSQFCTYQSHGIIIRGGHNTITLISCIIRGNSAVSASGVGINIKGEKQVNLHNVTIAENYVSDYIQNNPIGAVLIQSGKLMCDNVVIRDHSFSGIVALNGGNVCFTGKRNMFVNNAAISGGALHLVDSKIQLYADVHVIFERNQAVNFGGGIYITTNNQACMIVAKDIPSDSSQATLLFSSNIAYIAGDAIYGGNIEKCRSVSFDTGEQRESLSVISSDSQRVSSLTEDGTNVSSQRIKTLVTYPRSFSLTFVAVGQMNGTTNGILFLESDFEGETSNPFGVNRYGSSILIPMYSNQNNSQSYIIHVTPIPGYHSLDLAIMLNITILPCPLELGFYKENELCDCRDVIKAVAANCSIDTLEITTNDAVWIGPYSIPQQEGNCTVVYPNCPLDYCKSVGATFNLQYSPELQCNYNRSGTLCGGCAENMSLLLGSNACAQCTNNYLALIAVFALAGPALVAFLFVLNLTVTVGTINGLIFYANIVKLYEPVLHLNTARGPIPLASQFIAWMNLDLGIPVCFYNGMDAAAKVGLQFVFPVYLWLIILFIIYICKHSTRATRVLAHRSVQVLATLLLLSYNKLIRAIVLALYSTHINCYESDSVPSAVYNVWYIDANVWYFAGKHVIVFSVALLFLLFFIAPYTVCLLVFALPRQHFPHALAQLKNRLIPIHQAYFGIYGSRFKWWTGALLLVRLAFGLIVSFAEDSGFVIMSLGLLTFGLILPIAITSRGIYEKWYLNILEIIAYSNLLLTAYLQNIRDQPTVEDDSYDFQNIIGLTSVGFALATFVAISLLHGYWYVITPLQRRLKKEGNGPSVDQGTKATNDNALNLRNNFRLTELREPLLEI